VLFLFSDQHNAGFMGCAGHGHVKTPNLDKLAAKGTRFTRAYCQDGIPVPSRTSMMTGLYPRTVGCLDKPNRPPFPDRCPPLQHVMKSGGWRTGCFGKRHLARAGDMALGWDRSATTISPVQDPSDENYWDWIRERGKWDAFERDWKGSMKSDLGSHVSDLAPEERDAAYTAAKSAAFIKECGRKGEPFLCWATFHGPHQPYTPPARWADLYPLGEIELPGSLREPVESLPVAMRNWRRNTRTPWNLAKAAGDPDIYRRYISCYMGQVTEVDHYIGEVLAALDAAGLRGNTIVTYASDHGDFVGAHGMVEKCAVGQNVYEDTLRVPMIVSWPKRFRKAAMSDDPVELIDIYPTLTDALGLKRPAGALPLVGRSLVPTLKSGSAVGREYAVSENWSQATIVTEGHKLGTWIEPPPFDPYRKRDWRGKFPDMLFDRARDPAELTNLAGKADHARTEKRLRAMLDDWTARTSDEGKREFIRRGPATKSKKQRGRRAR
jgi:arylsulfatase A-like enzyme